MHTGDAPAAERVRYLDAELYVASEHHARFSWQGREYVDDALALDADLRARLIELEIEPESYGRALFAAVFPPASPLREGLREALAGAQGVERRLRLRLHLAPALAGEIHGILWELLFDPDRKLALGRSPDTAFSRYSTVPLDPGRPATGRPRLLGLIAAPRDAARYQMAPIDREATRARLERAFAALDGRMDFEILEPPATPARLRERLAAGDCHALHVFGHGLVRQRGRRSAALVLEDEDGGALFVDENVLADVFLGDRGLRLVTLVACHGGALSSNDAFSGLAARLVERGIPAVIGMCRPVTFELGHLFTDHLYRTLARSGRVDVAVNEARQQLYLDEPEEIDWSSPILYMRLPDGLLWTVEDPAETAAGTAAETAAETAGPTAAAAARPGAWIRGAALALLVAVLFLAAYPASEAEAELDLTVSRVAFTLARPQAIDRLALRELAATALDEIRLPRSAGPDLARIRRAELGRPLGLVLRAPAGDADAALSFQKTLIPAGRRVILEHFDANRYRLSIDRPRAPEPDGHADRSPGAPSLLDLSVASGGAMRLKLLHEPRWRELDGGTVRFAPLAGRVDLDLELARVADAGLDALEIVELSLLEIVEVVDRDASVVDRVSTIRSGTVVLGVSGLARALEPGEKLRFASMTGTIGRLEPRENGIALRVRGTFAGLVAEAPGAAPRRATVLGLWLGPGPRRALLAAAYALLLALLASVWSRPLRSLLASVPHVLRTKALSRG